MKITLIFLVCFVSLSYQQRWVPYPVPRELVYPGYYYQGNPYLQSFNNFASYDPEDLNGEEGSDAEGRISNKLSQSAAIFPKSFFFPSRLWSLTTLLSQSTSTSTVFTAVTSTTTVVTVQSCIAPALFSVNAGGTSFTTACARRRRDILEELIEKPDITPSKVEPLVSTLLAVEKSDSVIPEISSSLSAPNDESFVNRKSRALTVIVTTTSTFTSFSFVVTTVKKSFALVAAASLLCLPNGYTIC